MKRPVISALVQAPTEPDALVALITAHRLASQIRGAEDTLDRVSRDTLANAFYGGLVPTDAGLAADRNALEAASHG